MVAKSSANQSPGDTRLMIIRRKCWEVQRCTCQILFFLHLWSYGQGKIVRHNWLSCWCWTLFRNNLVYTSSHVFCPGILFCSLSVFLCNLFCFCLCCLESSALNFHPNLRSCSNGGRAALAAKLRRRADVSSSKRDARRWRQSLDKETLSGTATRSFLAHLACGS